MCDRTRGVGADGIVVVSRTDPEIGLRMFNPDGGEFERSGNGLRAAVVALDAWNLLGNDRRCTVAVGGGPVGLEILGEEAQGLFDTAAELGRARVGPSAVGLDPALLSDGFMTHPRSGLLEVVPVSVGNPHLVVFTDDLSDAALELIGPWLSTHSGLEAGANVQLALVTTSVGTGRIRIRIWERGVGRTSASGTSASAVVVAAVTSGRLDPGEHEVEMDGGSFRVGITGDLGVTLRGPMRAVCSGVLAEGLVPGD